MALLFVQPCKELYTACVEVYDESEIISRFIIVWSGGAMVLGKLSVSGRPNYLDTVGQGPAALAAGAGGVVWIFFLSSIISLFFFPLSGRRPNID